MTTQVNIRTHFSTLLNNLCQQSRKHTHQLEYLTSWLGSVRRLQHFCFQYVMYYNLKHQKSWNLKADFSFKFCGLD